MTETNAGVSRRVLNLTNASADEFSAVTDVPLLLGYMTSYFLQGILIVQVFLYYRSFRRTDPRYLQITVFFCFFVECLSTVLATMFVMRSIILFGDLSNSGELVGYRSVAVLCGLASSLVHGSYSWRIRVLGGSWILIVVVMLLSLVQFVMVSISGFGNFSFSDTGTSSTATLWLVGSAICDIIIASTLLYLLNYWDSTDRLTTNALATRAERVIAIAIDTGMITAISASIELLVYLTLRDTLVPLILFFTLPKLYANSLIATLNARSTLNVPGRGSEKNGDTNKNVSSSRRIETLKNVLSRRFGTKRSDTFRTTSDAEIEIDIREATPRSSVLDIRRHSVTYSKRPLKRNSIMGLKSGHQYREMSSVDAHPRNLATPLSFGIPNSTQDTVIDFDYSYVNESQSLVREID